MSQCKLCERPTKCVVNINFKAAHVCDNCCLAITKQTVAAIDSVVKQIPPCGMRGHVPTCDCYGDG